MNQYHDYQKKEATLVLGIMFSALHVLLFFSFVLACVVDAASLRTNFMATGIPLSFVLGFLVIICGIVLTAVYVHIANNKEGK